MHSQANFVVLGNNVLNSGAAKTYSVSERYNPYRMNPPFIYKDLDAQSQLITYVYNFHKLITLVNTNMITPVKVPCNVVLETTSVTNPNNVDIKYSLGLYLWSLAKAMKRIDLVVPD